MNSIIESNISITPRIYLINFFDLLIKKVDVYLLEEDTYRILQQVSSFKTTCICCSLIL